MFPSVQDRLKGRRTGALVDIAPLIDIVFILLIFFLVTTTFVRETGMEVRRPEAVSARALEPAHLRVSISPTGSIHTEGERVTLSGLERRVRRFIARERKEAVIIIPDRAVSAERLVEVMDAAKLGGAREISVATRRPG